MAAEARDFSSWPRVDVRRPTAASSAFSPHDRPGSRALSASRLYNFRPMLEWLALCVLAPGRVKRDGQ